MKRLALTLLFALLSFNACASASFQVSAVILPSMQSRVAAPAPTSGHDYKSAAVGEQWLVDASLETALAAYLAQLQAQGFEAVVGKEMTFRQAQSGLTLIVAGKASMGSTPLSQLTVIAYADTKDLSASTLMASQ